MKSYNEWLVEHGDHSKIKKDAQGGIVPQDMKAAKKVDLITLPPGIEGTHCLNCEYVKKDEDLHFCDHPEIQQYVNKRNCCAYWDHHDVKRLWKESDQSDKPAL